VGLSTSGSLK
jgi:hypothetical protein